jgi:hypothetical protein
LQLCSMTEVLDEIHAGEIINRSSDQMSHAKAARLSGRFVFQFE